jgi:hypothetical protein
MKRRIIISEQKITRGGQLKHFQIPLPKNTKRVVAIATDIRISPVLGEGGTLEAIPMEGTGEPRRDGDPAGGTDVIWNMRDNPLMGKLIMQSMEKANIFFYDQVWAITFDDGVTELNSVESMSAFSMLIKKEPKAVDVPNDTTVLNCLYKDWFGATFLRDIAYTVKVLVWIEYEEK